MGMGKFGRGLDNQGRLAYARFTADQYQAAWHHATAQDAVEFVYRHGYAHVFFTPDFGKSQGDAALGRRSLPCAAWRATLLLQDARP